ncbi:MAG: hypothetical protein K6E59_04565 [Bacilli bacterium]|nr:hypothetical protein [Bacilli bacterium]
MKGITLESVNEAANRLLFDMDEKECQALLGELLLLRAQMEKAGDIEGLDSHEPMVYPFPCEISSLRDDVPETPLSVEGVIGHSCSIKDNQIKVPKVVG